MPKPKEAEEFRRVESKTFITPNQRWSGRGQTRAIPRENQKSNEKTILVSVFLYLKLLLLL